MSKSIGKLAKRYAKAYFDSLTSSALPLAEIENRAKELSQFSEAVSGGKGEALSALLNPFFSNTDRANCLLALLTELKVSDDLSRFVRVLFDRGRINGLAEVSDSFKSIVDEQLKRVEVSILTARSVSSEEVGDVETNLKAVVGGEPKFKWDIDPSLIGGMKVSYQGKVVDGSVKGRLEKIKRDLSL